ncbi:hypothetical protein [Salinifilum ghardaiensis]
MLIRPNDPSPLAGRLRSRCVRAITGRAGAGECRSERTGVDLSEREECEVRAAAIRNLLCGKDSAEVDPRGVRLRGARVIGDLDLTDVRAEAPLVLHECEHDEEITLDRAHLPHLDLGGSRFLRLSADGLVCEHDLLMRSIRAEGLVLESADITGVLSLGGSELSASDDPALHADRITVHGSVHCRDGFTASSDSPDGTIRAHNATITGKLNLDSAQLTATNGPALMADGISLGDSLFCDGLTATSDGEHGTVCLRDAAITGQVSLNGAELAATNGAALDADRATIGHGFFCRKTFTASSDSEDGIIRLPGGSITGQLVLSDARLTATKGPALNVDGATITGDLLCNDGVTASSGRPDGTIRAHNATITGSLDLNTAQLTATNGPALSADGLTVQGSLNCRDGFTASSAGDCNTLRLNGAFVGKRFSLDGAQLTATDGSALCADGITVQGDLHCTAGFTASSDSDDETIRLLGATIAGQLGFRDASVRNTGAGSALDLNGARLDSDLLPLDTFADSDFRVEVAGLRYPFLPRDVTWREWLGLLARHTPSYAAQPYQQLAAVHREAGHEREARQILIAQQRDLRRRGNPGHRGQRLLHAASGLFIGYGHRPWRALGFLAGVCALAVGMLCTAHVLGLAVRPGPGNVPCAPAETLGAAIDTAVPILKTGGGGRCEIAANTGIVQVLYLGGYVLQAMGWAFATLFVAGYTGLIRQST